jgi:nucleoside-diphosphate-sugar epimerase
MRLFILGATGRTGRALLAQARERDYALTAFVRSPQKLGTLQEAWLSGKAIHAVSASCATPSLVTMLWCLHSARRDWDGRQSSAIVHIAP